jgi:hypothetical protein
MGQKALGIDIFFIEAIPDKGERFVGQGSQGGTFAIAGSTLNDG